MEKPNTNTEEPPNLPNSFLLKNSSPEIYHFEYLKDLLIRNTEKLQLEAYLIKNNLNVISIRGVENDTLINAAVKSNNISAVRNIIELVFLV